MTHIHTHACVNVCDFAINGSIYVLCFEIALVLIFYYGVINFSVFLAFHVITTTVVVAAAAANRTRDKAWESHQWIKCERERERERER